MRAAWLVLAGLTATCAKAGPLATAHAEPAKAAPPRTAGPAASNPAPPAEKGSPAASAASTGPLATFFAALGELRRGSRRGHVHVFWLGDSHTNADFLSGAVRSALAGEFGDGGPGFVRIGTKPYRHDGVKLSRDGAWNVDPDPPARRTVQDDGVFGLGGTRTVPGAAATFTLQTTARGAEADAAARFELAYSVPADASYWLELDGKKQRVDAKTSSDVSGAGVAHLALTAPLKSRLLLAPLGGAPRFFGVVVERAGKPGLVLDTVGIDGARLETPLAWNESAFTNEVARRAPELFIIAFGTNESFDAAKVDKYGEHLAELVRRLRSASPGASCLVLGPTDAPLGEGSVPRVAEVSAVLQGRAGALGCSFVSLQKLMGGEGSFARGMKAKERLAQLDKLHLTPKGYQELGQALAKELLDAYSDGRTDLP